jgi:ribosomal subunit interface protein
MGTEAAHDCPLAGSTDRPLDRFTAVDVAIARTQIAVFEMAIGDLHALFKLAGCHQLDVSRFKIRYHDKNFNREESDMQLPLQITFRNMQPSEAVEAKIRERAEKLDKYHDHIMSCRVVVEPHHKHHHMGNLYQVSVDVKVPDGELVANREPDEHHSYVDVYVAIRDAFDSMRRQLEDYARRRRNDVKTHEAPPHGQIAELHPAEDYGKIETPDGRLIYFHRNSLVEADFDTLKIGDEVRFVEEKGELGPQASTVHLVGKHHIVD